MSKFDTARGPQFDRVTIDPKRLADEIEEALQAYGLRKPERLFRAVQFREGELSLIVEALRDKCRKPARRAR